MTYRLYKHPSETGSPHDSNVTTEDTQNAATESASPNQLEQLQAELAAAKSEIEQWRDRYLRKAAEFDNFRKRTEKERVDAAMLAKSSVLVEFLPILDACERALESFTEASVSSESLDPYREGVRLLYKHLNDTLTRLGVVPIKAKGEKFDPHLHEAISREENPEYEENTIIAELRRGYLFKDRLLRPAQVKVSTHRQEEDKSISG